MTFKPMKAEDVTQPELLNYPFYASTKIDGVRCLIKDGVALSSTLKPFPNTALQLKVADQAEGLEGFDGELSLGEPNRQNLCRITSGASQRRDHPADDFRLHVFDLHDREEGWHTRFTQAERQLKAFKPSLAKLHPHALITSPQQLEAFEAAALAEGYEGVMLRWPDSPYKHGRATEKQQWLLKLKRFSDAEAVVIGVEELLHNDNVATKDNLGRTKRSAHKENKRAGGVLGALICRTPQGIEFRIGTGFTATEKMILWAQREAVIGRTVKYRFFAHGVKEAPRHPVFVMFRDPMDMGE